jgi:hypothetical protein
MIMNLTKRPGQIGPSINTRTEKHGEESVPGVDIPVSGLMLDKPELNALLQDVDAHDALYTDARGKQLEPRFQTIDPIALTDKFVGAKVTITSVDGETENLILKPAKIGKIRLEPQVGGLTLMSCTIQGNPPDHADMLALLNAKCRVSILNAALDVKAAADEPELPLDHKGQGEGPPGETSEDVLPGPLDSLRGPPKRAPRARRPRADTDG